MNRAYCSSTTVDNCSMKQMRHRPHLPTSNQSSLGLKNYSLKQISTQFSTSNRLSNDQNKISCLKKDSQISSFYLNSDTLEMNNQEVEVDRLYCQKLQPPVTQRRTSLHGKTITLRISRNETRYRKLQAKIYNFLERPKTWPSVAYHVFVFASVFGCLILSVLSTINEYSESAGRVLLYMELIILFWFFGEYCLRLWSAGCRSRYQTWRGRLHFARRPFCIVDVIVIVASVVVLTVDSDRNMFAASALRGLRFFQILRMIRMDRRGGSFKLLASVVWAHRQELFTTVYIGFLGLIFSSFLIYLVEKKENEKIRTYADALWWGVITLCTVGYGDTVPRTWIGKIIAAFCALAGISFFALPAGILGSGFALKVQQHQRQKHLIRRRVPAATLIQCLWRCYAADPNSTSIATWKIHTRPIRKPVGLTNSYSMIERGGFSRFSRFSTLKRRNAPNKLTVNNSNNEEIITGTQKSIQCTDDQLIRSTIITTDDDVRKLEENKNVHIESGNKDNSMNESAYFQTKALNSPTVVHYDCSSEHDSNLSNRLWCQITPVSRNCATPTNPTFNTNTDSLLSVVPEPDVVIRQLTENDKAAIRVIRKLRFFVARRKFREALRPYDVKDVIEQYSAGHVDMLARVKILQSRLDQILGRPGNKHEEAYDSDQCLASRIVKIEHKIDAVELKLDRLVNMYKTDRFNKTPNSSIDSDEMMKNVTLKPNELVTRKFDKSGIYTSKYRPSVDIFNRTIQQGSEQKREIDIGLINYHSNPSNLNLIKKDWLLSEPINRLRNEPRIYLESMDRQQNTNLSTTESINESSVRLDENGNNETTIRQQQQRPQQQTDKMFQNENA